MMYEIIIKILNRLKGNTTPSFQKKNKISQEKYINRFKEKKYLNSLTTRSYYQYKCQCFLNENYFTTIMMNIISIPGIILFMVYSFITHLKSTDIDILSENEKLAINIGYNNCIPRNLNSEFVIKDGVKGFYLTLKDICFFIKHISIKYPFSFYFKLKILVKISLYRYIMYNYRPHAILTNSEYSFTSSALTLFCKFNNVEHINIMHGEKLFDITDSFCEFDRFYVWDEYYIKLLTKLKMSKNQFIISNTSLDIFENKLLDNNIVTYYLQVESENELNVIRESLKKLVELNYKVFIRPHPRYSDIKKVEMIFKKFNIENNDVSIEESINKSNYIISKFSTVLYEAYLKNKHIVIDDISNRELYENLENYEYIILNKEHTLLSEMIKNKNIGCI